MKVTEAQVAARIRDERYIYDGNVTICIIEMTNGFKAVGVNGCVDPNEYNQSIGETLARSRALNDVWMVLGFELATQMDRTRRFQAESKTSTQDQQERRMMKTDEPDYGRKSVEEQLDESLKGVGTDGGTDLSESSHVEAVVAGEKTAATTVHATEDDGTAAGTYAESINRPS